MSSKTEFLTIPLNPILRKRIRVAAAHAGISQSEWMRQSAVRSLDRLDLQPENSLKEVQREGRLT